MFGYTLKDIPTGREWFRKAYPDKDYRHHVIAAWLGDLKEYKQVESRPRSYNVKCKDGSEKLIHFRPVTLEYEFRIMRPDRAVRNIHQSTEVSRDQEGNASRIFGIMQDITAHKQQEAQIRQSLKEKELLLRGSTIGSRTTCR